MRSKASIKSHPIHPILVSFPIAFFIGCLVFDLLFLITDNAALQTTGYHLAIAGVIGAAIAAVPGIIDFIYTVPPASSGKKRAAIHGMLNTTNLLLFIAVVFLKKNSEVDFKLIVALEAVGVTVLFIAGWLGGTLVYRNQIGVDPRYAGAGKWNEEYLDAAQNGIEVAKVDELQLNQMKLVHIKGKRIVIARSEKGFAAFNDHCTHKGGSLAGGSMICGTVQCPWHGSQFNVHDGSVAAGPAKETIETYQTEERDGAVYLHLKE